MTKATADQIACERFEHPATIALLLGIAAGAGPVDDDGNAAAYMIFAVTHKYGTGKPIEPLYSARSSGLMQAAGEVSVSP